MPIMAYFLSIKDPRIERNKLYPLYKVIVMPFQRSLLWPDIERYGKAKKA
jgi:hypothetical protein